MVPSAWTLCPEMNPLRKICSSELVLILWHVHTLTQTKRTVNHLLKAQRALLRDPTALTQVTHGGSGGSGSDGGGAGRSGPGDERCGCTEPVTVESSVWSHCGLINSVAVWSGRRGLELGWWPRLWHESESARPSS